MRGEPSIQAWTLASLMYSLSLLAARKMVRFSFGVGDGAGGALKVGLGGLLEVEGDCRVGEQVGVPGAWAGASGDVVAVVDVVEPDFDSLGLAAAAAGGGDVDDEVVGQGFGDGGVGG